MTGDYAPVHPQAVIRLNGEDVRVDEELAALITLMNAAGIATIMSCQDNDRGRGTVRRAWVDVYADELPALLAILNDPAELEDTESLSNRMAAEFVPDDDYEDFAEDRQWHYDIDVPRIDGELRDPAVAVRFPWTDVPEVVSRLRHHLRLEAARARPLTTDETWARRELPVLRAAVELVDEMLTGGRYPDAGDISRRTQMDVEIVATALNALDEEFLAVQRTTGDLDAWGVRGVTAAARRAIGQWPTAESIIEQLAAGFAQAAERESDPEQESRLREMARGLAGFANAVAVNIASQVIGQHIPR